MTWSGWLALAGVLAVLSVPRPAQARLGALVGDGRFAVSSTGSGWRGRVGGDRLAILLGFAVVVVIGVALGPLLAGAGGVVLGVGALLVRDVRRGRAAERRRDEVRDALGVLVGELGAGALPAAALSSAGETGGGCAADLRAAAEAARRAADPGGVLAGTADPTLRAVGVAWRVGEAAGAPLVAVLGRVAADVDAERAHRRSLTAALAGPKSSAVVLSGLPLIGIALGTAMGADPVRMLTSTPAGQALCCVGVLLDALGVLWVRQLLARAARP